MSGASFHATFAASAGSVGGQSPKSFIATQRPGSATKKSEHAESRRVRLPFRLRREMEDDVAERERGAERDEAQPIGRNLRAPPRRLPRRDRSAANIVASA